LAKSPISRVLSKFPSYRCINFADYAAVSCQIVSWLSLNFVKSATPSGYDEKRAGLCRNSWGHRMLLFNRIVVVGIIAWLSFSDSRHHARAEESDAADSVTVEAAKEAMQRATSYFTSRVAVHGGYVYYTSLDQTKRWGEGVATKDQIWVQPPGTPTVGIAFLAAYEATGDLRYLTAARNAGDALIYGQLRSGGWTNSIDFEASSRNTAMYRIGKGRGKNYSTLDDGITQEAIRFLLKLDRVEKGKNGPIGEAVKIALEALLKAQFPNGGFPQVWTGPVTPRPVMAAQYPELQLEIRVKEYWNHYTLNDGLAGTVAELLIEAHEAYPSEPRYREALRGLGDFLLLAQMPKPQPAWAQQYDEQMRPAWARKFEPPAIAGHESQDAIATLLRIHEVTGDAKYLAPIEPAIHYLRTSLLHDGQLARFYELRTNKPLYMDRQYQLTHDDHDVPSHYGWKGRSKLDALQTRYERAKAGINPKPNQPTRDQLTEKAAAVIAELDSEGRWVSVSGEDRLTGQPKMQPGEAFISSQRFAESLTILSQYIAAK
jgi:PelA/Pel-15E family pectate lyase